MSKGGRSRRAAAALLAVGALLVVGGCSRLQASLDKQDTVTLGDLAARMSALEQQVQDLQAGMIQEIDGQVAGDPTEVGQEASREATSPQRIEANKPNKDMRALVTASFLNVRAQPDTKATKVGALAEGAVVQVLAVEGDWAKVRYTFKDQAVTGWVSSQFLEPQE